MVRAVVARGPGQLPVKLPACIIDTETKQWRSNGAAAPCTYCTVQEFIDAPLDFSRLQYPQPPFLVWIALGLLELSYGTPDPEEQQTRQTKNPHKSAAITHRSYRGEHVQQHIPACLASYCFSERSAHWNSGGGGPSPRTIGVSCACKTLDDPSWGLGIVSVWYV